ncbi:MAG: site-specific integrase [Paracoccaceae bacterium]
MNQRTGAKLSQSSRSGTLKEISAFYSWLADQPGYKSKITRSDIAYLSPDRKADAARRSSCWKPHPSPAQVDSLLAQMPIGTVLQRRDRAFVAFLFLTGSRETAAISLKLRHIDLANACVHFNAPSVRTKFGKSFTTAFLPMGPLCEAIVREWVAELRTQHQFSDSDPLFPRTRVVVGPRRRFEAVWIDRTPWAGPSSAAKIFKQAFINAGLPPFSPHILRDTLVELAKRYCRTPEDYKA